jgi:hypothetical protein
MGVESVNLDKAFHGTAQLIASIWFGLEEQGYDLHTPKITPVQFPDEIF